jgi:hypothetical protein
MMVTGLLVAVGLVAGQACTLVVAQVMWRGKVDTWRETIEKYPLTYYLSFYDPSYLSWPYLTVHFL